MSREIKVFKSKTFGTQYVDLRTDKEQKQDAQFFADMQRHGESLASGAFFSGCIGGDANKMLFYVPKRPYQQGDYRCNPETHFSFLLSTSRKVSKYINDWGQEFDLPVFLP